MSNTDPPSKTTNNEQHGSPSQNKKTMSNTALLPKTTNHEQHGSSSQNKKTLATWISLPKEIYMTNTNPHPKQKQ
jgi:hypothetical protein